MTPTPLPRRLLAVSGLLLLSLPCARAQEVLRTLSGTVRDGGHEALRGAVVEVQDPASNHVISYITDADGKYVFKRLDSGTDYRVSASYRGHRSRTHSISKFDSHLNKVLDLVIKTY